MGMTATWVFEPADGVPPPPGWSSAVVGALVEPPGRSALVVSVWDSGFCLLDAPGHWRWVINEEITRGMHWGNVWTSGHLASVGRAEVLRESGVFSRVEPIAGSDLWWFQLTADPDELEHSHVDRAAWVTRAVMPRRPNGNIGLTAQ
ncbi:hypothetical protein [Allokutzneria sp. NRRL B-24872]|uniref:hypothetical protein n=1 Tax=Allokutzneria sp. NRRL B-24872 TaxID=1137961 RepID=UPI00117822C2|nr:hypothetical protein [Allokutzneria sp. NRRL B-24872]